MEAAYATGGLVMAHAGRARVAWPMAFVGLLLASALAGCHRSPTACYTEMATAAMMGDRAGFVDGFTKKSRSLVRAMISLSEAYGITNSNPYKQLVFGSVDDATLGEDGKTAVLDVRGRGQTRKILMAKEDGAWRIDIKKLAAFWKKHGRR